MVKIKFFYLLAIFFLVFSLIFKMYSFAQEPIDFSLEDLNGNLVKLSDYKGKNVLIFFWTIYCPHCSRSLTELEKDYPKLKEKEIVLLSINIHEGKTRVSDFIKRRLITYPVLLDSNKRVSSQFDLIGVPTFSFINTDGKLIEQLNYLPKDYIKLFDKDASR